VSASTERPGRLIAYTSDGVIEIPLIGEARADALLQLWAVRGGAIVGENGALVVPDVEPDQAGPAGGSTSELELNLS
jgi:hypothetical protein